MSQEALHDIIDNAIADYGYRLAVMWGPDDVIALSDLTEQEADVLRDVIVPELKNLPDPVEPEDRPATLSRLSGLAFSN